MSNPSQKKVSAVGGGWETPLFTLHSNALSDRYAASPTRVKKATDPQRGWLEVLAPNHRGMGRSHRIPYPYMPARGDPKDK
jgi:hypothetical protein